MHLNFFYNSGGTINVPVEGHATISCLHLACKAAGVCKAECMIDCVHMLADVWINKQRPRGERAKKGLGEKGASN